MVKAKFLKADDDEKSSDFKKRQSWGKTEHEKNLMS